MKIVGGKYLNNGNYDSIVISNDSIIVHKNENNTKSNGDSKFTGFLKDKSDKEIIDEIVNFYIYDTKLSFISNSVIVGMDGKKLYLRDNIDPEILKKIVDKYMDDRLEYFLMTKNGECSLDIAKQFSGYDFSGNYYLNAITTESPKTSSIRGHELKFISEILDEMYEGEIVALRLVDKRYEIIALRDEEKVIKIGELFSEYFLEEICKLVSNHNQEVSDKMVLSRKRKEGK